MQLTFIQYLNLIPYVILTMLDLFQLCYFGETLKQQTSHIGDALMRTNWYLCGGSFRRRVLIILSSSNKPMTLSGLKFFVLDYQKLTGVRSTSAIVVDCRTISTKYQISSDLFYRISLHYNNKNVLFRSFFHFNVK